MKQNVDTNHNIGDGESEDQGEDNGQSTLSSNIQQDDWDHPQEVQLLGQVRRDRSLRTTRV